MKTETVGEHCQKQDLKVLRKVEFWMNRLSPKSREVFDAIGKKCPATETARIFANAIDPKIEKAFQKLRKRD